MNYFEEEISRLILTKLGIQITPDKLGFYLETLRKKSSLIKKISSEKYIEYLHENPTFLNSEWKILIDSLNISETYFLRDTGQFEILERNIFPALFEKNKISRKIKVWSAGCSTGEEPYSIAILLSEMLEFSLGWEIQILATDINSDSIQQAVRGEYMDWSFRGVPEDWTKKYFSKKKNTYKIIDSIRKKVEFVENNLFHSNYYNEFDLILCRNVFIYFDDNSKKIIIDKFEKALSDNSYLMLGHSEAAHLIPSSLDTIVYPKSMVYKKMPRSMETKSTELGINKISIKQLNTPNLKNPINSERVSQTKKVNNTEKLKEAKRLADLGSIALAEIIIDEILKENSSNYEALFIKGQIMEATGNWESAIEFYKKVIYLNPDFLESYLTLSNLYCLLHNISDSVKIRKSALFSLENNENLVRIYKEKGYEIESLKSFLTEESSIWL